MQVIEVQKKAKQTNLKRHGCEYPAQNEEIKEKTKQARKDNTQMNIDIHLTLVGLKLIDTYTGNNRDILKYKCLKCGKDFKNGWFNIQRTPRCPHCDGKFIQSKDEIELYNYIKYILPTLRIDKSVRDIINNPKTKYPLELDIYIPEKKIAIEYNGLYWHSEDNKNKDYHLIKTNLCKEKEIQLIHIFEDEWINKKEIVKLKLKQILGLNDNRKIDVDKVVVKEINNRTRNKFLDKYHIEGNDNPDIQLGLFYYNELISVITFLKSENNIFKISRFCSNYKYCEVDIIEQLLIYFKTNYNWKKIYYYIDLRWDNGEMYNNSEFEFAHQIEPKYYYWKNNTFKRIKTKKDNDEGQYLKIYDCGYLKYQINQ